jgi:hypothetical protein
MKSILQCISLIWSLACFPCAGMFAQLHVIGPTCVTTATVYQYEIQADWKEAEKITICVKGGSLVAMKSSCVDTTSVSTIRIMWNEDVRQGDIKVKSMRGTTSFTVNIASPLNPGEINASTKKQITDFNKPPLGLFCSLATGGSCDPHYQYQWQQSLDKLTWVDMPRENGVNLSFAAPLKEALFFRRRVFDPNSGAAGYSNEVVVFVTPQVLQKL